MSNEEAIAIITNEMLCVGSNCDRDCGKCSLVKDENDILESFGKAITALEENQKLKAMVEKYEYHIDHTDCIWYRLGECPVTCGQYRDGWNDAMNYIFKGGEGYKPHRRKG